MKLSYEDRKKLVDAAWEIILQDPPFLRTTPEKVVDGVLAALEEDRDSSVELGLLEDDVACIHDALVEAGLEGAITAESIIERIDQLAAEARLGGEQ